MLVLRELRLIPRQLLLELNEVLLDEGEIPFAVLNTAFSHVRRRSLLLKFSYLYSQRIVCIFKVFADCGQFINFEIEHDLST